MVNKIHYRWDFVGLSTDTKPTPDESPKVVNGSTYYESDTSKLFVFYKDTWYERKPLGGGGGGSSYTAGEGIEIENNIISVDTETIQPKLTAGTNITIDANNVISAEGGSSINVVQTTGTSTTDVMSQKAVTDELFNGANTLRVQIGSGASSTGESYYSTIAIGTSASSTKRGGVAVGTGAEVTGNYGIAIGDSAKSTQPNSITIGYSARAAATSASGAVAVGSNITANGTNSVALGASAQASQSYSVALGSLSNPTQKGQVDISTLKSTNTNGYNDSQYRLLTGLYDGQSAHDAVTVEQVNATIDAINTALSTSIPHIGA